MIQTRHATVAVFRPADRSWWIAYVDPLVLGSASREATAMAMDWDQRHVAVDLAEVRPPTLVLDDPSQRFGRGCSTNSHFDDYGRAHTDPHADCAHGCAAEHIAKVAQLY